MRHKASTTPRSTCPADAQPEAGPACACLPGGVRVGWLICYDIADPKHVARLHRLIKGFAQPVQRSVSFFEGSRAQLVRRMHDIAALIDPRDDDVRAYPIPVSVRLHRLGRGTMPSGVLLQSDRNPGLAALLKAPNA